MVASGSSKQWLRRHVSDAFVRQARDAGLRSRAAFKLKEIQGKHRILRPGQVVVDCGAAPGGWTQVATGLVQAPRRGFVVAIDLLPLDPPVKQAMCLQQDFTLPVTQDRIRSLVRQYHVLRAEEAKERRIARQQKKAAAASPSPASDGAVEASESKPQSAPSRPNEVTAETVEKPVHTVSTRPVDVVLSDMAPSFSGNKSLDRLRTVGLAESALDFAVPLLRPGGHFCCKILQGPEADELRTRMRSLFENVFYEKPKSSRTESAEGFLVGIGFRVPNFEPATTESAPRNAEADLDAAEKHE
ncbi:2' O-ribose methyltransferase [Allomyces arbusculus]|nr:2' O-ribose methyltransferase [Allomyces arbusculus]